MPDWRGSSCSPNRAPLDAPSSILKNDVFPLPVLPTMQVISGSNATVPLSMIDL